MVEVNVLVEFFVGIIFVVSLFMIFWAMIGYGLSLKLIGIFFHHRCSNLAINDEKYSVTVMIVAHNEEKVIEKKLYNVIDNDYPKERINYIIASDNSTDDTNKIVTQFIDNYKNLDMVLYTSKEHLGKTNAQNEAQRLVKSDILVMTDANSMFRRDTISQLVSSFVNSKIKYVSGALQYINIENHIASMENTYWKKDLAMRLIESNIKTISAGNGAVYACRNKDYIEVPPIECHDSSMPYYYGKNGFRAVFNPKAIAYEKAGENIEDELKRKIRTNRGILKWIGRGIAVINPFKYGWFSYIFFGHRTSRYLLWVNHVLVLISNIVLVIVSKVFLWKLLLLAQSLFYLSGILGRIYKKGIFKYVYYYCMTIYAQWVAVIKSILGKSKATWEKAESTR